MLLGVIRIRDYLFIYLKDTLFKSHSFTCFLNSVPQIARSILNYPTNLLQITVNSREVVRPFKSCKWITHISIGKFPTGKQDYLFRSSSCSGNFPVERTKSECSKSQPEFPDFLVNGKRPIKFNTKITFVGQLKLSPCERG